MSKIKHYLKGCRYLAHNINFGIKKELNLAKIIPPKIKCDKPQKIKRVLLCLNRYEYGRVEWGDSYEYNNIFPAISDIVKTDFFDFRTYQEVNGKAKMHEYLKKVAMSGDYDLMFFSLMVDDFDKKIIREISEKSPTITINWFSDDQWRFNSFSHKWAGAFNYITTTDKSAVSKYKALGYDNVIATQWGVYAPNWLPKNKFDCADITFVGTKYGVREGIIDNLKAEKLNAAGYGNGWDSGRLEQQKVADIFANSKINISPTDSSILFAPKQMKARYFEIAACGGFQILCGFEPHTPFTDEDFNHVEIYDYFKKDEEIITAYNPNFVPIHAKYYLENEDLRLKIALNGQKRCLRNHTYQQRFGKIFNEIEVIK